MKHKQKSNRSGKLIAIFIGAVMILSVAGSFALKSDSDKSLTYNGYKFQQDNDGFSTKIDDQKIGFNFHPLDVDQISFEPNEISMLKEAEVILITSDPENPLQSTISFMEYELETKLSLFNRIAMHGVTEENASTDKIPFITCDSAGEKSPVIYLKKGNSTEVKNEGNCLIITAKDKYNLVKVKDALLYRILGVIE